MKQTTSDLYTYMNSLRKVNLCIRILNSGCRVSYVELSLDIEDVLDPAQEA